jgi:hypothetical protein
MSALNRARMVANTPRVNDASKALARRVMRKAKAHLKKMKCSMDPRTAAGYLKISKKYRDTMPDNCFLAM